MQFKAFAQTVEEIIATSETPITIGVYGAWGSGKTSLMRMTQDLLKDRDKIKTVWFDALSSRHLRFCKGKSHC